MLKSLLIAIDGPAGSGKSTAAKLLAEKLGFIYLDTGAMYRAITCKAIENNIVDDIDEVIKMVKNLNIKLDFKNSVTKIFVDGEEFTDKIRSSEVNAKVSEISKIPEVRKELVKIQRRLGENGGLVAEGRDTTTVVFPDADVKIFLTATLESRIERRYKEFIEKGQKVSKEEVRKNIEKRDQLDSQRSISPLRKADDAIEFDNTSTPIDPEIDKLLKIILEKDLQKNK